MNIYIECLIDFVVLFTLIFLVYMVFINKKRKKDDTLKKASEVKMIIARHNLNMKKIKYKNLLLSVSIANSFILSFTAVLIIHIKSIWLSLLIGFIVVVLLTYSLYEIIGRHYKKKEMKK